MRNSDAATVEYHFIDETLRYVQVDTVLMARLELNVLSLGRKLVRGLGWFAVKEAPDEEEPNGANLMFDMWTRLADWAVETMLNIMLAEQLGQTGSAAHNFLAVIGGFQFGMQRGWIS